MYFRVKLEFPLKCFLMLLEKVNQYFCYKNDVMLSIENILWTDSIYMTRDVAAVVR